MNTHVIKILISYFQKIPLKQLRNARNVLVDSPSLRLLVGIFVHFAYHHCCDMP